VVKVMCNVVELSFCAYHFEPFEFHHLNNSPNVSSTTAAHEIYLRFPMKILDNGLTG